MPLVRSASAILLQGTPSDVSLDEVRTAILRIPGVEDVHGTRHPLLRLYR